MTSKNESTSSNSRTVVVLGLKGLQDTEASPDEIADWSGRLQALFAVHASDECVHPTGFDLTLGSFADPQRALVAVADVLAEVESTRSGHRHGGLIGVGIASGSVKVLTDDRIVGLPVTRALRLQAVAERTGCMLATADTFRGCLPVGFSSQVERDAWLESLSFGVVRVDDYR